MVSPGHKRQVAQALVKGGHRSGRQACRHFGLHRNAFALRPKNPMPGWENSKGHCAGSSGNIRSDKGREFIAGKLQGWLESAPQINMLYIDPGSPWQNGYIESFNGRLQDECLEREQLST